jgi:DNA-binding FadR family transcriptional regulator
METSPPPGLHADLLDKLGRRLADGELAEGAVLRAEELAARFDVSRTVVREAVRVLESMGMITSRRRVGLTVAPRTSWNVYDPLVIRWRLAGRDREAQLRSLSELRAGVEPVAARFAALRASPEQCGVMTGAVMDMAVHSRSGDLQAYLSADVLFHRTLLAASGNEMLGALADVVAEVLTGRTVHGLMPATPDPAAVRLHADVAQAVQARDGAAAHRAMTDIITEATAYMLHEPVEP